MFSTKNVNKEAPIKNNAVLDELKLENDNKNDANENFRSLREYQLKLQCDI